MEDMAKKIQELLSDEESMKQLSELAEMFESGSDDKATGDEGAPKGEADFDIGKAMGLFSALNSAPNDENAALLLALKPLLGEERRLRVDKAVKLLKLASVAGKLKSSGMLKDLI